MNKILFVICCKDSNYIFDCIESINSFYLNSADIVIVDSCSNDKSYFDLLNKYKNIFIEDICNKNYEYGSILHAFKKYNQYDIYIFIQDSLRIKSKISEIKLINNNEVYIFGDDARTTGWILDPEAKNYFYLKNPWFPIINRQFFIAQWNCFIINSNTFKKVINSNLFLAIDPPNNKISSRAWERIWSIVFYINNIQVKILDQNLYYKLFVGRQ